MTLIGIAAAVAAIALILLVAFIIPVLVEIRKAVVMSRETLASIQSDLRPVLKELRETLADIKAVTGGVSEKVDDVKEFMDAIGDTGRGLRTINSVIGTVAGVMSRSTLWLTGAKVTGSFILDKIIKKRGERHV
jgi:uncharacterized protein YoxC